MKPIDLHEKILSLNGANRKECLNIFRTFDSLDWREFLTIITHDNHSLLARTLPTRTDFGHVEVIASLLSDVDYNTREQIKRAMTDVWMSNRVRAQKRDNLKLSSLLDLTLLLDWGVDKSILEATIIDKNVDLEFRIQVADRLARMGSVDLEFWDELSRSTEAQHFIWEYLEAIHSENPKSAMRALDENRNKLKDQSQFIKLSYFTVELLVNSESPSSLFRILSKISASYLKTLVKDVLPGLKDKPLLYRKLKAVITEVIHGKQKVQLEPKLGMSDLIPRNYSSIRENIIATARGYTSRNSNRFKVRYPSKPKTKKLKHEE